MQKGDILVGDGFLVHQGGGSPVAVEDDPTTHGIPGLLNRNDLAMNTLALHVFLDPDATRGNLYSTKRVDTVPVRVTFDDPSEGGSGNKKKGPGRCSVSGY